MKLTHTNEKGYASMVDVSDKSVTIRYAKAVGTIHIKQSTLDAISENNLSKGDAFPTARIAGILAAKRCDELITLCHSLPLSNVNIEFTVHTEHARVDITAKVTCEAKTGAEMEALMAVSITALTIYDMIKAVDREAWISDIHLLEKSGGKSGHFVMEANTCREE